MAKLLSYYHLCPINDQKEFLGLSQGRENGTVINTLGRNIIINFKLSNQKQINSWTVLEKLSSKVVYDCKTKQYVGAFASKWVRCWDQDCSDINKMKRIKLAKPIENLISIENKQTLVLYTDGTCESLEYAIDKKKDDRDISIPCNKPVIDSESVSITDITYFKTSNDSILIAYFTKSIKNQDVQLVYFRVDSETFQLCEPVYRIKLIRKDKGSKLCGYTVVDGVTSPQLVTIWSDKRLFMLPLTDEAISSQPTPGHFVALISAINIEQPLSILGISKDCVAIYGANPTPLDGGSLILYNTQFKVIESKQSFKIYFDNSRLWVVDKYIFLATGQTLAVVSFRISKEQLSDMIGSQRITDLSNLIDTECINADGELEEMIEFDMAAQIQANAKLNNRDELLNGHAEEKHKMQVNYLQKDLDTVDKFNTDLRLLHQYDIELVMVRDKNLLSGISNIEISSNPNDDTFSSEALRTLTKQLEQCGASETEITDCVLPLLLKFKLTNDLAICVRKYSNINDKMIVRVLKYFIDLNRKAKQNNEEDDEKNLQLSYLNDILRLSFNSDLILKHLRNMLSFDDVVFLLEHIFSVLKSSEDQSQNNYVIDDDSVLLKWLIIILDSSYQQFIISHNSQLIQTLDKWKELLDNYIKNIESAKSVTALMNNLVNGKSIYRDSSCSKWYTVEEFKLY